MTIFVDSSMYRVGEGWAGLCGFLGCEVPDTEFPHENKAGTSSTIQNRYNHFDVFQRGNSEVRRSLLQIGASISLFLLFVFKKQYFFHN